MSRDAQVVRKTNETDVRLALSLDGGSVGVSTGIGFFDHMLTAFGHHGSLGISLTAVGDLNVDQHHTMEDIGLALGQAVKDALGDKRGITRYGLSVIPMDESLARCVIDLSGRPYLGWHCRFPEGSVGGIPMRLFREFFQAFVNVCGCSLHIDLEYCEENHHGIEAVFKAFGHCLAQAVSITASEKVLSTKGSLKYN